MLTFIETRIDRAAGATLCVIAGKWVGIPEMFDAALEAGTALEASAEIDG